MVQVTKEFVEAVDRGKKVVPITEVILAELAGGVPEGLERLRDGDIARLNPDRRARDAYLGEAGALRCLSGDER